MVRRVVVTSSYSQGGMYGFTVKGRNQLDLVRNMYRVAITRGNTSRTMEFHRWKHWPLIKKDGSSVGKVFQDA
jgi:hypothetical protein